MKKSKLEWEFLFELMSNAVFDVERLFQIHAKTKGFYERRALINSAVVMTAAYWEASVEIIFEIAVDHHYSQLSVADLATIKKATAGRMNTPHAHNINVLFLNVGIANIFDRVNWENMSSKRAAKKLDLLLNSRHFIAHGQRAWKTNKCPTKALAIDWFKFARTSAKAIYTIVRREIDGKHDDDN